MSVAELVKQVHELGEDEQTEFFASAFEGLTLIRVVGLVKHLEDRWDVEATPNYGGLPQQQEQEPEEVEQTEFDVVVTALGDKRMDAVKALRRASGMDLKASNALLKEALPVVVNKDRGKLSKEDAEAWKKELEESGCQVDLK